MAFEYATSIGLLRLAQTDRGWVLNFVEDQGGIWTSPDAAVSAAARHETGLRAWDRANADVPDDLLDWRPLGESL